MKATLTGLLVLGVSFISPISHANTPIAKQLPVKSYALQDVRAFNAQLAARKPSNNWQNQPIAIALEYLKGASGGRATNITSQVPQGEAESPSMVIVKVVQDGFLDDSVRGQWDQLTFRKDKNQRWLLQESRRAFLCGRGSNTQVFQKGPCP